MLRDASEINPYAVKTGPGLLVESPYVKLGIFLVAASLVTACATSAAAQRTPEMAQARERAAIAGCVAAHLPPAGEAEDFDPRDCIGDVTRACHRELGDAGETTAGSAICATREQEAWKALFDSSAEALRQRETASQRVLLEQAIAQGEVWARARCAYEASLYEGASLARVLSAHCLRDTTAERSIDMQRRLRDYDQ